MINGTMIREIAETITTNRRFMDKRFYDTLGKRVRLLRTDAGLSQEALAESVGIRQAYLSEIEKDKANPTWEVVAGLARRLNTTADFLVLLTDDPASPEENHKPTYLHPDTEQAARMIDAITNSEIRAQALQYVIALHDSYQERAGKERHIRELLALIEASNGSEYRKEVERRLGLRSAIQSGGESFSL